MRYWSSASVCVLVGEEETYQTRLVVPDFGPSTKKAFPLASKVVQARCQYKTTSRHHSATASHAVRHAVVALGV